MKPPSLGLMCQNLNTRAQYGMVNLRQYWKTCGQKLPTSTTRSHSAPLGNGDFVFMPEVGCLLTNILLEYNLISPFIILRLILECGVSWCK